ncbi:uncharacterized protein LOC124798740 [Schistocerca piceifrons]|uniref:uncharacterized protein LOC124798740 n=1 Tax=Schistocerca piceifrons TaxID=274613 RepID=UPI001F5F85CD|nr:uncharacterized protein LOC124798740 [Schistocerca piceifrons]
MSEGGYLRRTAPPVDPPAPAGGAAWRLIRRSGHLLPPCGVRLGPARTMTHSLPTPLSPPAQLRQSAPTTKKQMRHKDAFCRGTAQLYRCVPFGSWLLQKATAEQPAGRCRGFPEGAAGQSRTNRSPGSARAGQLLRAPASRCFPLPPPSATCAHSAANAGDADPAHHSPFSPRRGATLDVFSNIVTSCTCYAAQSLLWAGSAAESPVDKRSGKRTVRFPCRPAAGGAPVIDTTDGATSRKWANYGGRRAGSANQADGSRRPSPARGRSGTPPNSSPCRLATSASLDVRRAGRFTYHLVAPSEEMLCLALSCHTRVSECHRRDCNAGLGPHGPPPPPPPPAATREAARRGVAAGRLGGLRPEPLILSPQSANPITETVSPRAGAGQAPGAAWRGRVDGARGTPIAEFFDIAA